MALAAGKGSTALHVAMAWKDIETDLVRELLDATPEVMVRRRDEEEI